MLHLREVEIGEFRGIRGLHLKNLGDVNLLVGDNNIGKTSVLEAIDLECHPLDILRFVTLSNKRNSESVKLPTLNSVQWMFPNQETKMHEIMIASKSDNQISRTNISCKETRVIESHLPSVTWNNLFQSIIPKLEEDKNRSINELINEYFFGRNSHVDHIKPISQEKEVRAFEIHMKYRVQESDHPTNTSLYEDDVIITNSSMIKQSEKARTLFPTELITPIDHRSLPINSEAITESILSGGDVRIIELLNLFDQDIIDLKILSPENIPVPYLTHKKLGHAPISVFGDGIRRALTLATAVVNCKDGVLLIDEIETAVHVHALKKVFSWLVAACKRYNIQLFATTHSLEAIDAILDSFQGSTKKEDQSETLKNLVTYKLLLKGDKTIAKRIPGDDLKSIRVEFGLDVR